MAVDKNICVIGWGYISPPIASSLGIKGYKAHSVDIFEHVIDTIMRFYSDIVEGFNNKVKLTTRTAHGFRAFYATQIALYHTLVALPVPETTRNFSDEEKI